MKELSIEEKAKAYDEALKVLHKYDGVNIMFTQDLKEEMFPELKESEDEKIRKELITHCRNTRYVTEEGAERIVKWISWLEKQGNLMKALQISNAKIGELIEKNYYLKEQLEKQGNNMGISEATKQKLEDNLNKALEKETAESWNKFLDEQGEQKPVFEMKTPEESLGIDSDTYNKIVDECVYGEQKPIKEHNACEFCEDKYGCVNPCSMKLIEEEKPTDKIESRQEELTEFEKAVKQVMEEAIECGDTHNLKADADMLLRLVQKSSWSEEDERTYKSITYSFAHNYPLTIQQQEFVKYLKDRVQPQSKQEWSEDTQQWIDAIIFDYESWYDADKDHRTTIQAKINILKSLRPHSTWKPSDEQIEALADALSLAKNCGEENAFDLRTLYEQLKKLREE